ncbi:MAG: GNAT family N-acetyltransferase [Thermoanaerobaculia bacterium]
MARHGEVPVLETERLRLRGFRPADLDEYAAIHADIRVQASMSDGAVWDRGRSWRHLAFVMGHWDLAGVGLWAVETKAGDFVGKIGFWCPEGWPGLELAWALAYRSWGKGYATEGARAALRFAFEEAGQDRIISLIRPGNERSVRVAERLGECREGMAQVFGLDYMKYGIDRSGYLSLWAA